MAAGSYQASGLWKIGLTGSRQLDEIPRPRQQRPSCMAGVRRVQFTRLMTSMRGRSRPAGAISRTGLVSPLIVCTGRDGRLSIGGRCSEAGRHVPRASCAPAVPRGDGGRSGIYRQRSFHKSPPDARVPACPGRLAGAVADGALPLPHETDLAGMRWRWPQPGAVQIMCRVGYALHNRLKPSSHTPARRT